MDKTKSGARSKAARKSLESKDSASEGPSPNASLAMRPSRVKRQSSAVSVNTKSTRSKKPRVRPDINRSNSTGSAKHLQVPAADDVAIVSGDESVIGDNKTPTRALFTQEQNFEPPPLRRPAWTVRHKIYLDNELLSCTTSIQRAGYHKFADFLLREQIETRLYSTQNGQDAHFATRHAVLRFWRRDGSLAEKWMDKDWGGQKEHEFAMENMNDWTILHLAMGAEEKALEEAADEGGKDEAMDDADGGADDDADSNGQDPIEDDDGGSVFPTMDITSHYLRSYYDARNISSAPAHSASSLHTNEENADGEDNADEGGLPEYHWLEERRRDLEHQLRAYYHCTSPQCFNKGGTCLVLGSQHLHVGVKDLTDWSQQIAHANRSIAATTLHLAAKLIDDQTRAQDERLADVGREREDEDHLEDAIGVHSILEDMRPSKGDPAELEALE